MLFFGDLISLNKINVKGSYGIRNLRQKEETQG